MSAYSEAPHESHLWTTPLANKSLFFLGELSSKHQPRTLRYLFHVSRSMVRKRRPPAAWTRSFFHRLGISIQSMLPRIALAFSSNVNMFRTSTTKVSALESIGKHTRSTKTLEYTLYLYHVYTPQKRNLLRSIHIQNSKQLPRTHATWWSFKISLGCRGYVE